MLESAGEDEIGDERLETLAEAIVEAADAS
jgi:hypothetical protein